MTTLLTAGGMGLVIFVFSAVLMLADGLEKTLVSTGSKENVVFIRRSSETEVQSMISREEAAILESLPEIVTDRDGRRMAARELVILIGLKKLSTNSLANVLVRGVRHGVSLTLRPQVRISQGREFQPGTAEIVIGRSIAKRFDVSGLGQTLYFGMRNWTVVGIMDSAGSGFDSEVWADADLLMATFRRPVYSSFIARVRDAALIPAIRERALKDPRLTVEAWQEIDYYAAQSELMSRFIRILGVTLTLIFSLGAIIGSMVTMYAAVANRMAEIGTLRALGFRRASILTTFLLESLLIGLIGGIIGIAAASLMDRLTISTMNWQTFSELSFRFTLSQTIVLQALAFSATMGLMGGMFPALRAARLDIVTALRLK